MSMVIINLLIAQFLSAFADNAILFATLAIVNAGNHPAWYLGVVQGAFFVAYILLAPFVGTFADSWPKSRVLIVGNAVKALGTAAMFLSVDPVIAYAIVGVGAVIYSPAKYGLLPELAGKGQALVRANGWMEGTTILAILAGAVGGGILAAQSIPLALGICMGAYLVSAILAFLLPKGLVIADGMTLASAKKFLHDGWTVVRSEAKVPLMGAGVFWGTSAALRLAVIAWIPLVFGITEVDKISAIVACAGIGVAIGAALAPRLAPLPSRARWAAIPLGLVAMVLPLSASIPMALLILIAFGAAGGIFLVPMNAAIQEIGVESVGVGQTIAILNLIDNVAMLMGAALYTGASALGVAPGVSIAMAGLFPLGYVVWTIRQFPRKQSEQSL
ncbi:lysophospholipid transporter LplT [Heliophilum fasciatum]|uniref:LPLT family lysophospholipid transporter-like MFS transporter n=1 Tax=Heliophilum fasciatum TaxID=35700 RepID=A0A4R2RWB0_9FIRM|nr:lysophospholipid transporter LplT [Heliophilum fasciatum]MCW2276809.1 LPLT family lysophospholipid transporter-like MFS transporter [Heliophilum fasciatum]TCP68730.1 LPLT family lysophospholipid transporter-like MFS transporter [Heliophilum fasciatum]